MHLYGEQSFQDGIVTLAKVEEAYKHEKETKEEIEEVIRSRALYHLLDNMEAVEDGTDENRLLPAMNKIWPLLVVCVQSKNPVVSTGSLEFPFSYTCKILY